MICFSTQRSGNAYSARWSVLRRSQHVFLRLILGVFIVGLSTTQGQTAGELYRGTWQIDTPDEGSLILIVKRQGRASYFWGDNADRTVYQGTWTMDENGATLTWNDDNTTHQIERDTLGYNITHRDAAGNERYTVPARQVPREVLGQWAQPPVRDDALASDRDQARGFFGTWRIGNGDDADYVFVEPDRSAASNWSTGHLELEGLRGVWARQGSELHIIWDSGHYSILREGERGFSYKRIEPGLRIEDDTTEFRSASRTSEENVPQTWFSAYQAEREADAGGVAFASRADARRFYRGSWLIKRGEETYERITVGRFGGLGTSRSSSLSGDWMMDRQDLFMRWDDGMRKILSPVGRGFVLYEYQPGRPLDGVPTRVLPATPTDAAKLAEHMRGRTEVSAQILTLAEAAGIDASSEASGWGRSFARWAWPFGGDEAAQSPALLVEDRPEGTAASQDPWWWPFWSERSAEESMAQTTSNTEEPAPAPLPGAAEQPVSALPSDGNAPTVEPSTAGTPATNSNNRSKKNWYWPF